jgi:ketol-acid reductoisomerase
MALTVYSAQDADIARLRSAPVAVIGYGNQGQAHALNLRDSGVQVVVGQRPGRSFERAVADAFSPIPVSDAGHEAALIILTLPDESAAEVYERHLASILRPGQTLGFVHGFNIRFGLIRPPSQVDVIMIAPKGPGTLLRSLFLQGKGLPALLAVEQDATGQARQTALAWAAAIGATRAAVIETTFAQETETDLFGEQSVLCGGVTALMGAAFETLTDAGYEPEFAYLECIHELKQIVDLIYERGISGMRERISTTARYGDLTRGPRLINEATRTELRRILAEIRDGSFADEWIREHRAGGRSFRCLSDAARSAAWEQAGRNVRVWMPWLNP